MQNPKLTAFIAALTQKVATAKASGLLDKSFVQVTDTFNNKYISLSDDAPKWTVGLCSSSKPVCVTHSDFDKIIKALTQYYTDCPDMVDSDTLDNYSFDAVDGDSTTKFTDPNNGMLMDSTGVVYGSYGATPPPAS